MFFYQGARLAVFQVGLVQQRVFGASKHLLAIIQERAQASLLATDVIDSVLFVKQESTAPRYYSPYGCQAAQPWMPGYTGQVQDAVTEGYLLGNGYRLYNPKLMRFHSPDSWSPFGKGGLNTYSYGAGDPLNGSDPTGHMLNAVRKFLKASKYHDPVAARNAAKIFNRSGKLVLPPSERNVRNELDRMVISASNNLQEHRKTLNTLPDEPKFAEQRNFAKERIQVNQELINKAVRRDMQVQQKYIVEPSSRYISTVRENGDFEVQVLEL